MKALDFWGMPIALTFVAIGLAVAISSTRRVQSQPPPLCNHDAFHQELQAQSAKLEALEREHADTRVLAAFGGAKMRGPRTLRVISCDGGAFLEGSFGQRAWRALAGSGLCSPDEPLPGPEAHR